MNASSPYRLDEKSQLCRVAQLGCTDRKASAGRGFPLALGTGTGAGLRRPLGITIVGGLMVSQLLTLYTTPVVYLYLDRLRNAIRRAPTLQEASQT